MNERTNEWKKKQGQKIARGKERNSPSFKERKKQRNKEWKKEGQKRNKEEEDA